MKITNKKIVENMGLIRDVSSKQLTPRVSYTISRNLDHLESVTKTYEKERQKLLDKYAEKDDKGKLVLRPDGISVKFKDDVAETAFKKDVEELLNCDNDIDIRKVKLDDLKDAQGNPVAFSAAEITAIDYMIDEK